MRAPGILLFLTALLLGTATAAGSAAEEAVPPERTLTWTDVLVLGVVEGITEFLPVSSTGHLIIANRILGLDQEIPLGPGNPFTLKSAADAYAIVIQAGAIGAVAFLYWHHLLSILRGMLGRDPGGLRLLRNLAIALVPAVTLALLLERWIDTYLFSVQTVAAALIAGAVLMLFVERRRRKNPAAQSDLAPKDLQPRQAMVIGLMQCLALWPGTSRSMVTIVGGYMAGLSPARAAEFSFLLGLPVLTGAAVFKGAKSGPLIVEAFGWLHVVAGCLIAAVSAAVAIKFLIAYLSRHGLSIFAYYRLLLATALLLVYST